MARRQLIVLVCLLASLSLWPGSARASHTQSNDPPHDFAVGGGTLEGTGGILRFSVSAQSGPLGEDPDGFAHFRFEGILARFPITCMITTGNRAVFGGPRTEVPGDSHFMVVVDNQGLTPDLVNGPFTGGTPANQAGCAFHDAVSVLFTPLPVQGNVIVHDALPAP